MTLKRCWRYFVVVGLFCIGAAGCGESSTYDGPERASISGKVTFNGAPIETGSITFTPEDGSSTVASAPIGGGAYWLSEGHGPNLGTYKVSISASKPSDDVIATEEPELDDEESGRPRRPKQKPEEILPAKYNTETELKVEVESGSNTFDFDLKP